MKIFLGLGLCLALAVAKPEPQLDPPVEPQFKSHTTKLPFPAEPEFEPTAEPSEVPSFRLMTWERTADVPEVEITFPNGHKDMFMFVRNYPHEEDERDRMLHCNFLGHLKNEKSACAALSGCPGQEDVDITLFSKHLPGDNMFTWSKDGIVKSIPSPFPDLEALPHPPEMEDYDQIDNLRSFDAVNRGDMPTERLLPSSMVFEIKVGYDKSMSDRLALLGQSIDTFVSQVFSHAQAYYCHASLASQIQLKVIGEKTLYANEAWKAEGAGLGKVKPLVKDDTSGADLFVFFCDDALPGQNNKGGTVGIAYTGVVCYPNTATNRQYFTSINEYWGSSSGTAAILAHELGHNLGMRHDFDVGSGSYPHTDNGKSHMALGCNNTGSNGIMDYKSHPSNHPWSTCSVFDLNVQYSKRQPWCAPPITGTNPCGEPALPICGIPVWKGDGYCDDENNNSGCDWDGGDCCNNTKYYWNGWCTACECLDPAATNSG